VTFPSGLTDAKKTSTAAEQVTAVSGGELDYSCAIDDTTNDAAYKWTFTPTGSSTSIPISDTSRLYLTDLSDANAGEYTCEVTTSEGSKQLSVLVDILQVDEMPTAVDMKSNPEDEKGNSGSVWTAVSVFVMLAVFTAFLVATVFLRRKKKVAPKLSDSIESWGTSRYYDDWRVESGNTGTLVG
jgi:hypothetical protein